MQLGLSAEVELSSRLMIPMSTIHPINFAGAECRMLKVPFDNDDFVRYQYHRLDTTMTSYEVTSIYSGEERRGVVIGSIDHDHWKSAIDVKGENNSNVSRLRAYSGVSDQQTRDELPHGSLHGTSIKSARFYLGCSSDWRDGMERFAWANTRVVPVFDTWTGGTPFGWQSWGVLQDKCNWTDAKEITDYYADVLQPGGFCNSQGNVIFSFDAGDGMNTPQKEQLCREGAKRGQTIGIYSTPFSLWWDEASVNYFTEKIGDKVYPYSESILKVNGKYLQTAGAFARDPTHPITKQSIVAFVNQIAASGIRYVKCDFVNAGIIQADSYYKEGITTAVEAYNEGMRYLADRARAKGIFVALSISPLFPYQYANSRRIACDTWGSIDQTEYSMSGISGGWWTSHLYQYNDPDHIVLVGNGNQFGLTLGENRARYTGACITGMVLVADNFSTSNVSGRGNPSLSKTRAAEIMLNRDVNEMADLGVSFRPVYGYKEHLNQHFSPENFHMYRTDDYLYVAGINYSTNSALKGNIPFDRLGITTDDFSEIKELWTGQTSSYDESGFAYDIPLKDARIYRFKLNTTGVKKIENDPSPRQSRCWYDLGGRIQTANHQGKGILISDQGRKILK